MIKMLRENKMIVLFLAIGLMVVGVVLLFSQTTGTTVRESLGSDIEMRDEATGEVWMMNRGRLEAEIIGRAAIGKLDPKIGIIGPKGGSPTSFPVDRGYWDSLIQVAASPPPKTP